MRRYQVVLCALSLILTSVETPLIAQQKDVDSTLIARPDSTQMLRNILAQDSADMAFDSIAVSDSLTALLDTSWTRYDTLTFSVVGDIMVHDAQLEAAWSASCGCYSFDGVFHEVQPYLESADFAIGNLETTLSGGKYSGYPAFNSPDTLIHSLKEAGFDILLTANNHSLDRGARGLKRTVRVLDRFRIQHLGTYPSHLASDTSRVLFVEKKGMRVALLNYTYGTNGIPIPKDVVVNLTDKKVIAADLALAKKEKPDAIIVFYHFGPEYARQPSGKQKDLVRFTFQQGADAVIGSHPHVVQPFGIENIADAHGNKKDRLVVYSLGNFVSNQRNRYTNGGILFNFSLVRQTTGTDTSTSVRDPGFVPTWVEVATTPSGKKSFRVLPARDFLEDEKLGGLSELAQKKLKEFYEDTMNHLLGERSAAGSE